MKLPTFLIETKDDIKFLSPIAMNTLKSIPCRCTCLAKTFLLLITKVFYGQVIVDEDNEIGTVDFAFDFSKTTINDCNLHSVLLVDSNSDFSDATVKSASFHFSNRGLSTTSGEKNKDQTHLLSRTCEYIDEHLELFSSPATLDEVQDMVNTLPLLIENTDIQEVVEPAVGDLEGVGIIDSITLNESDYQEVIGIATPQPITLEELQILFDQVNSDISNFEIPTVFTPNNDGVDTLI